MEGSGIRRRNLCLAVFVAVVLLAGIEMIDAQISAPVPAPGPAPASGGGYLIGYGALTADRVACPPQSGRSYYTPNCASADTPVAPYQRTCSTISRCARDEA